MGTEQTTPLLLKEIRAVDSDEERIPEWKDQITIRGLVMWTGFQSKFGFSVRPFTRQENTVIQTCVVACCGLAASGGFGSYFISMDEKTYKLIGEDYPGNRAEDVKNPGLLWMMAFLFLVSFIGLFSLVPLRKVMILGYKLTYPSGTATAMLINSFHTNTGAELAG
ncbi:hypothetical protein RD792_000386 [Penstemon davidsonii]|uniref:Uncharacterized protein n=1 Tax=Penstemon davidsonii TaxID=160366 RepID=A0ABR0DKI7_9LAMI|nr:hypothetical protein RD792_000386 [Penstemon davidsonii]